MKRALVFGLLFAFVCGGTTAYAGYTVTSDVVENGDSYTYNYHVYNINQGGDVFGFGLDGLALLVPGSSPLVQSHTVPPPYWSEVGWWSFDNTNWPTPVLAQAPSGYSYMSWWGNNGQSVYPVGTTAHFSVTVAKPHVPGLVDAWAITYDGSYGAFHYSVLGPTPPVPEPSSLLALVCGLGGFGGMVWRRSPR